MNAKKVIGALLLKPAFTQRNITSVMLVAVFFGVYILMGGTVSTELPQNRANGSFGSTSDEEAASKGAPARTEQKKSSAAELLGVKRSPERARRERASYGGTGLFTDEERKELEDEPLDRSKLVTGIKRKKSSMDRRLDRIEARRKNKDALSSIEERLNINRGK